MNKSENRAKSGHAVLPIFVNTLKAPEETMKLKELIRAIANIGIGPNTANDEAIRIRILNVICVIATVVITFLYSFRDVLLGRFDLAFFHFLLVLVFIPPLALNRLKRFHEARLFLFITFPISLVPYNYFLSDVGSENYLFSLVLLCFLLLEKTRTQFTVSVYCGVVFMFLRFKSLAQQITKSNLLQNERIQKTYL